MGRRSNKQASAQDVGQQARQPAPPQQAQQPAPPQYAQQAPPQGPPQGPPPGQYPDGYWPGQYPPAGYPPPKPKKKWYQRVWFWILAVIVVIIFVSVVSNCGGPSSNAAGTTSGTSAVSKQGAEQGQANKPEAKKPAAKEQAPKTAGIGDSVKSGHFKFTVTKVQDGVSQIGPDDFGEKAQGQFILVSVTVTNVGDSSELFMGSDQKLLDGAGKEYSADDTAGIYLDESNSFLEAINPGNTVHGKIVFDVPKTVSPKYIEFSGALFSSPVKVSLG